MAERVVITGIGPVCGLGMGKAPLWDGLMAGRSAIGRIARWDPSGFPCQAGAEVPADAFDIKQIVPKSYRKATKVMCRDVELAVGAALAAVEDAGLITKCTDPDARPTIAPDRFGCHIGAGLIAADLDELTAALVTSRAADGSFDLAHWGGQGMQNLTPLWLLKYLPNMLACHVTIVHDCRGPSNTITCNEASGLLSMGESLRVIQRGDADACLTGGAESRLNPMGLLRLIYAERMVMTNGAADADYASLVRPFDVNAAGTVVGEGGAILVIETESSAKARGKDAYAAVAGFAASHSFTPDDGRSHVHADGEALATSMKRAMERAGLTPGDIDAILPLGSGIPDVDQSEREAIRTVFGERAAEIPLITTTANVGNCIAGSSAVGLCVAAQAIAEQTLPARINTQHADGLDANACAAREAKLNAVLVISPSQGGQNAAAVLTKI